MPKDLPNADFSIKVIQGEPVKMPSADMLIDADFTKDGGDLVIESNGQTVTVEGYFSGLESPDLMHDSGLRLTPEMIDSFAKSSHAGEYAQGGNMTMNDASPVGQITEIVGDVVITRADGTEVIAEVGTVIQQGDIIETSADGAANIMFADNTSFAVSEDARLSVDEFKYDSEAQEGSSFFSMLKGAFVYTSGMIGKDDPGNVNIETPTGSIGIRGTVVMGKIDPTGQNSEITILDGAVVITNAAGSVELDDMFETVRLGGYDQPPQNLGQMTADYVQSQFKSLDGVARGTFGRAFGQSRGQNNNEGDGEGEQPVQGTPDLPAGEQPPQQGEMMMQNPDAINKAAKGPGDVVVGRKMPLPPKALEAKPFSEGLPDSSSLLKPPPADIQDPASPPPDVFAFRPINTATFRVREFDDLNHVVGKMETFGNLATGVAYSMSVPPTISNPFVIDSTTGVIRVADPYALDASDYGAFIPIRVTATNVDGTSISQNFNVTIDALLSDLSKPRIVGDDNVDTITASTWGPNEKILFGGNGNDTINDDDIYANVMVGGAGDDTLQVTNNTATATKRIFGGSGNDAIELNHAGDSVIHGDLGDDHIKILDNTGRHVVFGDAGNDRIEIFSNGPEDSYDGGLGKDTLILNNSSGGSDLIIDFTGMNAQKFTSIEEIYLDNNTSSDKIEILVDGATADHFSNFQGTLVINGERVTGSNFVKLKGNWIQLNQYDGQLFGGQTNSAAFQRIGTNEIVATEDITQVQFLEEHTNTPGNFQALDGNGLTPGDTNAYIPELSNFL